MIPYNFVPLGPAAERKPVATHEKFHSGLLSGKLFCKIETLTELFVAPAHERAQRNEHVELDFIRDGNTPIIPGSSLKGTIRNVAEVLSGSCLNLAGDRWKRSVEKDRLSYFDRSRDGMGGNYEYSLPDGFTPCGIQDRNRRRPPRDGACPVCRIFGYLERGTIHLGNVNFSAAVLQGEPQMQWLTLAPSGTPGPRHLSFYGKTETGFREARGRKFYYHRIDGARTTDRKTGQNKTVHAILPGAVFEFSVDYQNLQESELALLIFSLILEAPVRHKIGMGKSLGLGSVQIAIREWQKIDMAQRYKNLGSGSEMLSGETLESVLGDQRQKYHDLFAQWREPFETLRDLWTWDEQNPSDPQYPTIAWFDENRKVPLEEVPDDAATYRLTTASRPQQPRQAPGRYQSAHTAPPSSGGQADAATLARLQKEAEAQQQRQEAKESQPYQDRDVEKAKIVKVEAETFDVELGNLPGQAFTVSKKNKWRPYKQGDRIRVRILVNAKGEITRVEEI